MGKNKYIQLLEWSRDNIDGITGEKLQEKLKELNLPSDYDGMQGTLYSFTRGVFHRLNGKFMLTIEAYFQLLEHERLEEARIESGNAIKIAIWTLRITILFLITSIIIGILQLCKI